MRTVFITGSTDGIGKEAALMLARKNFRVLIHGKDPDKIDQTISWVKEKTLSTNVVGYQADLSSLNEVEKMITQIRKKEDQLDILLNNAGVIMQEYGQSKQGFEMTFAVNHLAHFYLTGRLLPLMLTREKARIVNLTSKIQSSTIDFRTFLSKSYFESVKAYSDSKLCNVLFTYKLGTLLKKNGITVNCMHPGVINTKMLTKTWGSIGAPVQEGAAREVYLSDSSDIDFITKKYFVKNRMVNSVPYSYKVELQEALWTLSLDLLAKSGFQNPYDFNY